MGGEWRSVSLGEANVRLIDCVHKTPSDVGVGFAYLAIPQMKTGAIDLRDARRISPDDFATWTLKAKPEPDDVVLSRRCNPGVTAHVPNGVQFALGQNLVLLRSDGSHVFPPFLRWLVRSPAWWNEVGRFINVGAVFESLRCGDVPKFELPVPPLPEQRRIAAVLGALDDKIELNRKMNETLEAMAQALFKSWFVDFDPVIDNALRAGNAIPDDLAEKAQRRKAVMARDSYEVPEYAGMFPDGFVDSEFGWIPKGWRFLPVKASVDAVFDGPHATPSPSPTGPVFLGIRNLTGTGLNLATIRRIAEVDWPRWTKRVVPRHGDIVFCYEARLGDFALLPPGLRCCLGRRMALVRPLPEVGSKHFLFHYFTAKPFQSFLRAHINPGSTVDRILLKDFPNYPVLACADDLRERFEVIGGPIWTTIHKNQAESQTLAAIRDTLLPKLITGEIRVPADVAIEQAAEATA